LRATQARQVHGRLTIGFLCTEVTVSNAEWRIAAVCYGLQIGWQRTRTAAAAEPAFACEHGRQSPWLPAGRELGIRTIEGRLDSSQLECCGQ
jgi:hypothetical protein